jgi:hypothetical protein
MNYPLYNDELCPKFWDKKGDEYKMKSEVRDALMTIATDFIEEYLKEAELTLTIQDVILIGSSTNYNWTPFSDLDLHILVDYDELGIGQEYANIMLTAIKINWNKAHDIKIKGHKVEIYVQGIEQDTESVSIYSVQDDKWIEPPEMGKPKFNKKLIKKKHKQLKAEIDEMLKNADEEKIQKMITKLYDFRQAGLDNKKGEFSEENIVFKILRAQGYLDKMKEYSVEIYDKENTLKEGVERSLRQGITPAMGNRRWSIPYGKIPDTDPLQELAYPGNMGVMEIVKFYDVATPEQVSMFEQLATESSPGSSREAWLLIQAVTGEKLYGAEEFGTQDEVAFYKRIKGF